MKANLFLTPKFQVLASWLWLFLLPLSLMGILVGILNLELNSIMAWWREHQYYQGYFEALTTGLLPLIFVWLKQEKPACYGVHLENLAKSILLSLLFVGIFLLYEYFKTDNWINHSDIAGELGVLPTIWYTVWGVIANGPLEVFFYIFLLEKTDDVFNSGEALLSKGFWIITTLHALDHVITTQSLSNALNVFVIFFFLGLIYRYTKNALGPMLGWTLINGMVWAFWSFAGVVP